MACGGGPAKGRHGRVWPSCRPLNSVRMPRPVKRLLHSWNWTDDPMEREERDRVTRLLQAECEKYRAIANAREFNGPRVLALCTRKIC